MTVLVTGGAGFLGTALIARLLARDTTGALRVTCLDRSASPLIDGRVRSLVGDLGDHAWARRAVPAEVSVVWHLAAVLSGQSEMEPALAWQVNVGGTEALLAACQALERPPRFVFASTIAVYGGPLPDVVSEDLVLRPQSTYGTTKAVAELLVLEATRRGVVDGLVCRVPTVAVRPGVPNSALSSFVSGIVREPLNGQASTCPVPLGTPLWVASPDVTTANLAHAGAVPPTALGPVRMLNLPGITVTPAELLESLERRAGAAARARVRLVPDARVSGVVGSWPGAFDVTRARALGFVSDADADALVAQYMAAARRDS